MRGARIDTADGGYLIFEAGEGAVPAITVGKYHEGFHRLLLSPISARAFADNILTLLTPTHTPPKYSHGSSEPCDICDR